MRGQGAGAYHQQPLRIVSNQRTGGQRRGAGGAPGREFGGLENGQRLAGSIVEQGEQCSDRGQAFFAVVRKHGDELHADALARLPHRHAQQRGIARQRVTRPHWGFAGVGQAFAQGTDQLWIIQRSGDIGVGEETQALHGETPSQDEAL